MTAKKRASGRTSARRPKSDMTRVDAHTVRASEYRYLPEINDEMMHRAVVKKSGCPISKKKPSP